jgi:hypothetical protein
MNDSWESFAAALAEESAALGRVHDASASLTQALVRNSAAEITAADCEFVGQAPGHAGSRLR